MARGDIFEPDDDRFDMRRLGRTALWGTGAVAAVLLALLVAQSEPGSRRLALALNGLPPPLKPAQPLLVADPQTARFTSADPDARRLAETLRLLSSDRDRLTARLEALERTLDVTGSTSPPLSLPLPPSTTPAAPVPSGSSGGKGPQQPARQASQPQATPEAAVAESVATKTEFGVDLGGETTLDGLRTIWMSAKAQHAGLLDGLRPVIAVRENGKMGPVELRLVAGPLANAAAAARLCAALASSGSPCQPTTFDGQRLALR
jgi:hypothetical protein